MTRTLGNLMGQNHNHIYSAIAVKEIVPDSDIIIYKFVQVNLCLALLTGLSILLEVRNIHFSFQVRLAGFLSVEAVRKSQITIRSLSEVSNVRRKRKERMNLYRLL